MDTKASILLVIAGILTTTSLPGNGVLFKAAVVCALSAGVAALVSLWPIRVKGIHPKTLTDHITGTSESFADYEHWLLSMEKGAAVHREKRLRVRGIALIIGFVLAVLAMSMSVLSLFEFGSNFATWLVSLDLFIADNAEPTKLPTASPAATTRE